VAHFAGQEGGLKQLLVAAQKENSTSAKFFCLSGRVVLVPLVRVTGITRCLTVQRWLLSGRSESGFGANEVVGIGF